MISCLESSIKAAVCWESCFEKAHSFHKLHFGRSWTTAKLPSRETQRCNLPEKNTRTDDNKVFYKYADICEVFLLKHVRLLLVKKTNHELIPLTKSFIVVKHVYDPHNSTDTHTHTHTHTHTLEFILTRPAAPNTHQSTNCIHPLLKIVPSECPSCPFLLWGRLPILFKLERRSVDHMLPPGTIVSIHSVKSRQPWTF